MTKRNITGSARRATRQKQQQRWRKGQSSSSNPECTQYRRAAHALRTGQTILSDKQEVGLKRAADTLLLTEAALVRFNQQQLAGASHKEALKSATEVSLARSGASRLSAASFATWATNFTGCSNPSFSKVLSRFKDATSKQQKAILAVLAGTSQLLKKGSYGESDYEYAVALTQMVACGEELDASERVAAVYLLSIVLRQLPIESRHRCCPFVVEAVIKALDQGGLSADNASVTGVRSALECLGQVLAPLNFTEWTAERRALFQRILTSCISERPRVRRAAVTAVTRVLSNALTQQTAAAVAGSLRHPAASLATRFCCDKLACAENQQQLAGLRLSRIVLPLLGEAANLRTLLEAILSVLGRLPTATATEIALDTIRALLNSRPSAHALPAERLARLLTALHQLRPSDTSAGVSLWLQCVFAGVQQLIELQTSVEVAGAHALQLMNVALPQLLPDLPDRASVAREVLNQLIDLMPNLSDEHLKEAMSHLSSSSLALELHVVRGTLLQLLANFIERVGERLPTQALDSLLTHLASLRDANAAQAHAVDTVLFAVVGRFGAERLLSAVPLQLGAALAEASTSTEFHFTRAWLLPVLREALNRRPDAPRHLSLFSKHLLPLADAVWTHAQLCTQRQFAQCAARWLAVEHHLWQLLSALVGPAPVVDLLTTFRMPLTRILADRIESRPDLRADILCSLRRLAVHANNEEERAAMKPRNFLPRLFNLFRAAPPKSEERLRCLETIRAFLGCADSELLKLYFTKCLENAQTELISLSVLQVHQTIGAIGWQRLCEAVPNCTTGAPDRLNAEPQVVTSALQRFCSVLDLLIGLAAQFGRNNLSFEVTEQLLGLAEVWLQSNEAHSAVQKKAYRLVQTLLESGALLEHRHRFMQLVHLLTTQQMANAAPSARKPRLRCLLVLVSQEQDEHESALSGAQLLLLLSEALASMHENNSKARETARALLRALVQSYQRQSGLSLAACLYTVIQHVTHAALTGPAAADESAIEASFSGIAALLQLAQQHQRQRHSDESHSNEALLSSDLISHLLEHSRLLVARPSRVLVRSGLLLLQQTVRRARIDQLSLASVLDCLAAVHEEQRSAVRFAVKALLRRLCTRFGAGLVAQVTAPRYLAEHWPGLAHGPYQRMLRNLVKGTLRTARQRLAGSKVSDKERDQDEEDDYEKNAHTPAETMQEILSQEAADELSEDEEEDGGKVRRLKGTRREKKKDATWLEEGADEILDLGDERTLSRLHSTKKKDAQMDTDSAKNISKDGVFPLAADGRMLILDEDANADDSSSGDEDDNDADGNEDESNMENQGKKANTKLSLGSSAIEEPCETRRTMKYAPGGRGIHRPLTTKKGSTPQFVAPGAEFCAKRAGGDVKRGAVNPYSYVTLNRSRLNRRNVKGRQDALAQFRALTKARRTVTGSASGCAAAAEAAAAASTGSLHGKRKVGHHRQQKQTLNKRRRIH